MELEGYQTVITNPFQVQQQQASSIPQNLQQNQQMMEFTIQQQQHIIQQQQAMLQQQQFLMQQTPSQLYFQPVVPQVTLTPAVIQSGLPAARISQISSSTISNPMLMSGQFVVQNPLNQSFQGLGIPNVYGVNLTPNFYGVNQAMNESLIRASYAHNAMVHPIPHMGTPQYAHMIIPRDNTYQIR